VLAKRISVENWKIDSLNKLSTVTLNILLYQSSNEIDDYRLVFIVLISLLRKILNACQNEIHGIVAYTFLNVCEKIYQFLLCIKKMHAKENWFLFSASWCL